MPNSGEEAKCSKGLTTELTSPECQGNEVILLPCQMRAQHSQWQVMLMFKYKVSITLGQPPNPTLTDIPPPRPLISDCIFCFCYLGWLDFSYGSGPFALWKHWRFNQATVPWLLLFPLPRMLISWTTNCMTPCLMPALGVWKLAGVIGLAWLLGKFSTNSSQRTCPEIIPWGRRPHFPAAVLFSSASSLGLKLHA